MGRTAEPPRRRARKRGIKARTVTLKLRFPPFETLTRAWSAEFADSGIRVNAVSPGVIRDPALDGPWSADGLMAGTPSGGSGGPDAIAAAVAYLASDEAEFVHGTVLDVDGGRTGVAVVAA